MEKIRKNKIKKKHVFLIFFLMFIFLLGMTNSPTHAQEKYSFDQAEALSTSGLIHWREYGPDAFSEAVKQNKPIFLLLTAPSWCYWCQVYESKDYLFNDAVYPYIDQQFIPVYVDADKRQDLTRQYLEGGWPSTTLMTPDGKRISGFSGPRSTDEMLSNLRAAVAYVQNQSFSSSSKLKYNKPIPTIPSLDDLTVLQSSYLTIAQSDFDPEYGGFGTGQKFPQAFTLKYLLDRYSESHDESLLNIVSTTIHGEYTEITKIGSDYRLFDPIEGGFHRYGTTQAYSPPHYEKMLYDNVKELDAYAYFSTLKKDDTIAKNVVTKTSRFIEATFYDKAHGGFYGNVDAGGEANYYGLIHRPAKKPRVEKTKYTDWNAISVMAYFDLSKSFKNPHYENMATRTLDWFTRDMVSSSGAYHYEKETGEKAITGNLLDNSYTTLTFVAGYETTGNKQYLKTAQQLADYSLNNLYDWNGGGFFERHSTDSNNYAPQELILLTKPLEENGVMALAMAKLYNQTSDIRYLNAAIKTLGQFRTVRPALDSGYFLVSAADYIRAHDLLSEYVKNEANIHALEQTAQQSFWLNTLFPPELQNPQPPATSENSSNLPSSLSLLIILSLLAGLFSILSPCTLPIVPAALATIFSTEKKFRFATATAFFLGILTVFILLGISASLLGSFIKDHVTSFSHIAGIAIILLGIMTIIGKGIGGLHTVAKKPATIGVAYLFGGAFALSWTPCVGPILGSILVLAATAGGWKIGALLLLFYGTGLIVPLLAFIFFFIRSTKVDKLMAILKGKGWALHISNKVFVIHTTTLVAGLLFIGVGILIFTGQLYALNRYALTSGLQQYFLGIEGHLLKFLHSINSS